MIICLAGPRASGKSTTARCLAALLGWRSLSFGDYVREVAKERGRDPQDLLVLQDVGLELIGTGWDNFCNSLLAFYNYKNENVIIEGVRHAEAVTTLSCITQTKVVLVYLDVHESVQNERIQFRNRGEYKGHESHEVERQVKCELRDKADLIIRAELPTEEVAKLIIQEFSI